MSISMKNLEDRVKVLEGKTLSSFLTTKTYYNNYSGTTSEISTPDIDSFDCIYVAAREACGSSSSPVHPGGGSVSIILPVNYNQILPANHVNSHSMISYIVDSNRKCVRFYQNDNGRFIAVVGIKFGLKLYYNFSTLIHFIFNLLTKKEVKLL